MRKIDLHSYGDTRSDEVLAEDLNKLNDYETKRAVGRILDKLSLFLKNIEVDEPHTKGLLYKVLREYELKRIERPEINRYPKLKTFLTTSIISKLRNKFVSIKTEELSKPKVRKLINIKEFVKVAKKVRESFKEEREYQEYLKRLKST